jgi:hypothetical protein
LVSIGVAVFVYFTKNANTPRSQVTTMLINGETNSYYYYGNAVSISKDKLSIAVGTANSQYAGGAVYLFQPTNSTSNIHGKRMDPRSKIH